MPRGEFDRSGRRAQTRARLLDAAARVYARRGFDAATLDEVAEEAGFTKGAVYDHFGSKENLLFALLDEHLSAQIAEQIALFDPATEAAERPRAGAERWMDRLDEDPEAFRLFVEAWVHAQRDGELRPRVAAGIEAWRETFREFGRGAAGAAGGTATVDVAGNGSADGAGEIPEALLDQVATLMVALGAGLGLVRLADPESVSPRLLGATFVVLLRALETSERARAVLASAAVANPARPRP